MNYDKEMLEAFTEEVKSYLPLILEGVRLFKTELDQVAALRESRRYVHSIKGGAAMMGLSPLSHIAFFTEDILEELIAGNLRLTRKVEDFLFRTISQMEAYLEALNAGQRHDRSVLDDTVREYRRLKGLPLADDTREIERLLADLPPAEEIGFPTEFEVPAFPPEPQPVAPPPPVVQPTGGFSDDKDPELIEIYLQEAGELVQNISQGLRLINEHREAKEGVKQVRRAAHTLKGAAGLVGFHLTSQLANQIQDLLDKVQEGAMTLNPDLVQLLFQAAAVLEDVIWSQGEEHGFADKIQHLIAQFKQAFTQAVEVEPPDIHELMEDRSIVPQGLGEYSHPSEFKSVPDSKPPSEPTHHPVPVLHVPDDVDPELFEIFLQEADEHLTTISHNLRDLEHVPGNLEMMEGIRRAAHTLKGAAGMVGYRVVSQVAHRMEDLLDKLHNSEMQVTPEILNLLFVTSDMLEGLIQGKVDMAGSGQKIEQLYQLYANLLNQAAAKPVLREGPVAFPTQPVSEPARPRETTMMEGVQAAPATTALTTTENLGLEEDDDRNRDTRTIRLGGPTTPMIRVPIERLDELVRMVSELVVNRSVFEQYFRELIREVDELKFSLDRLRRISTKFETDYETLALTGRTQQPGRAIPAQATGTNRFTLNQQEFDELEFDRYTEFHLLTRALSETTSDVNSVGVDIRGTITDFESYLGSLSRLTSEIQDKLMRVRLVPLGSLSAKLTRAVKTTATTANKQVDFLIDGEQVELDKTALEGITDPLLHLLRNSVDHGIERPEIRAERGKPLRGTIKVRAFYEATQVVIIVSDDGNGIDPDKLRAKVIKAGLATEAELAGMPNEDLYSFIFVHGLSTADTISEISGRGVGMDVVKSNINKMKGTISIYSEPGKGITFTVRLPMTLAATRVILVKANGETFAVPLAGVTQILRITTDDIEQIGHKSVIRVGREIYPLIRLGDALGLRGPADTTVERAPALLFKIGDQQAALVVDHLLEAREVVIKTMGNLLRRVRAVTGATLMGDGSVVVILNLAELVRESVTTTPSLSRVSSQATPTKVAKNTLTVLIVDDSVSVRRVLTNVIRSAGWTSITAKDGLEALEILQSTNELPDLMLLDVEMPRMDGYELTATLRSQPLYHRLPIVMLTSRAGDKHRKKAFDLGVTEYLVKPYQDEALLNVIRRLTGLGGG
ncbi:MAG: Hpt domain-containing protein [Blastocatellia bacterium]|nr:Hpt domain-containing protein [Blastocatellia bacterium]